MADPTPAPFPSPAPGEPPFLKLAGIGKVFPGVVANEDVSIDFRRGEIHALLGENGAGKSTLMNVVTGMYQPDAGELIVEGYGVAFPGPPAAIAAGIGMVHQHFKLVPRFTVAENLALGWNRAPAWVSPRAIEAQARELSKWFGLAVRPQARIDTLSAGEQQRVEILRVLSRGAKLLILDEPTAVLSPDEIKGLFSALRRFRDGGGAVVIITHKLDEVMAIADRCSVLRAGRLTGTHRIADTTSDRLVAEMIGRSVDLPAAYPRSTPAPSADALTPLVLDAVSVRDAAGVLRLDDVNLAVRAGEILGIAGVSGNGQPELARVMTGLDTPASGRVFLDGNPMSGAGPAGFAARGVGHVPEDRLRMALAPALGVTENGVLREYASAPVGGRLGYSAPAARRFTETLAGLAGVRLVAPAAPMRGLSGGNQQRLVLAREERIARNVLVASYPARGLDIGAIAAMRERLAAARDAGVAVVLISEDLDEILALSDRIAVLHGGRLMGEYPRADARRDEIGRLMSGQHARDGVAP